MKRKFTDIYNEIYKDYLSMEQLRKNRNIMAIINVITFLIVVVLIGVFLFNYTNYIKASYNYHDYNSFDMGRQQLLKKNGICFILLFIVLFVRIKLSTKTFDTKIEYKDTYKQKIIKPLIESYNGKLKYQPLGGDIKSLYNLGRFEPYDIFFSEDYIYGEKIKMSEVRTVEEYIDENGIKQKRILFFGLFSIYEASKFLSKPIEIVFDRGLDNQIISDKVLMDSGEFEKYFDVYGAEKIEVMQLLTSDVLEVLIKVRRILKCNFEIKLIGNKILIRYHTGDIFEADEVGVPLTIQQLKDAYDLIDNTIILSEYFEKAINECEL